MNNKPVNVTYNGLDGMKNGKKFHSFQNFKIF